MQENTLDRLAMSAQWNKLAELIQIISKEEFTYDEGLAIEKVLDKVNVKGLRVIEGMVTNKIVSHYCGTLASNIERDME